MSIHSWQESHTLTRTLTTMRERGGAEELTESDIVRSGHSVLSEYTHQCVRVNCPLLVSFAYCLFGLSAYPRGWMSEIDMLPQGVQLSNRPHVIIATPGRLADHIRSGTAMHLKHLKFLVLDEVDRLLEKKFKEVRESTTNKKQRSSFL